MKADRVTEVVRALIGPIEPVGETHTDDQRYDNLRELCAVVDQLLTDIDRVNHWNKNAHELSRKRSADYASGFYDRMGIPND